MKNKNELSQRKINAILRHRGILYTALLAMSEFERAFNTINKTHRGAIVCNILRTINDTKSNEYRTIEVADMVEDLLNKREYTLDRFNKDREKKCPKITDPYALYKSYKAQSEELNDIFKRQLEFLAEVISESYYYHFNDKSEAMEQLISIFNEYGIGIEDNSTPLNKENLNESAIDVLRHLRENTEYDKVEKGVIHLSIITGVLQIKDILIIAKRMRRPIDSITNEYSYMGIINKAHNKLREATKDIDKLIRKCTFTNIPLDANCRVAADKIMDNFSSSGEKLNSVLSDVNAIKLRMPKTRVNIHQKSTMPEIYIEDLVDMVKTGLSIYIERMTIPFKIGDIASIFLSTAIFSALMAELLEDNDIIAGMDIFTVPFSELVKREMLKIEFNIALFIDKQKCEKQ